MLPGEKAISENIKVRLHRAGVFFGHRETAVSDKTSAAEDIQAEFIYPLSLGEEELSGDGLAELLLKYIGSSIENPGIIIELKSGNAVSESRVAQIIAVLRLAGGNAVKNICVCPISSKTAISGANVTLIAPEKCCDDNETDLKTERKNIEIEATRELFSKAGYKIAAGI